MKTWLAGNILLATVWFGCSGDHNNVNENGIGTNARYFGEKIDEMKMSSVSDIHRDLDAKGAIETKLGGTIVETCSMKGCWMKVALDDGTELRVTFKDYGFFVPNSGMEGKKTVIAGVVQKKLLDVEEIRHFAEDEGQAEEEIAKIKEPREEFTLVAHGVIIADNPAKSD